MMKYFIHLMAVCRVFALFHSVFSPNAYAIQKVCAYLDPGTGSFILQLIAGIFFGGLFALKLYWNKIKAFFKNLFSGGEKHGKSEG